MSSSGVQPLLLLAGLLVGACGYQLPTAPLAPPAAALRAAAPPVACAVPPPSFAEIGLRAELCDALARRGGHH